MKISIFNFRNFKIEWKAFIYNYFNNINQLQMKF